MRRSMVLTTVLVFLILMSHGTLSAGEKKLMHCFYFTPITEATDAEWEAFKKATNELPGKIPGLNQVWHGKLRRPYNNYNSRGEKRVREYGVCMELDDEAALDVYADHPAHTDWVAIYEKVRQRGTSTFDVLGE